MVFSPVVQSNHGIDKTCDIGQKSQTQDMREEQKRQSKDSHGKWNFSYSKWNQGVENQVIDGFGKGHC